MPIPKIMPDQRQESPGRIAIVGGGITGIACLWGLRNTAFEVHLYEADAYLGGHSHSFTFENNGNVATVDTGFIAAQEDQYPNFTAFLKELKVSTISTDMSLSVSEEDGSMAWSSSTLWSFIGSWSRLCKPWFWRLIFDIVRFNFFSTDIFAEKSDIPPGNNEKAHRRLESIGEYLDRNRYSEQFKKYYLIPAAAAPWCMSPTDVSKGFPAEALIHFMSKHRLLNTITETLKWRSFKNGSKTYVDAFLRTLPRNHHCHLETKIHRVRRQNSHQASLVFMDGSVKTFDHVVLAVHASQALGLLGEQATSLEKEILDSFRSSRNESILHLDPTITRGLKSAPASWNCVLSNVREKQSSEKDYLSRRPICIHNDMNRLQGIPLPGQPESPGRVFVSLNPTRLPSSIQCQRTYYHPIIDSRSVQATSKLHLINRKYNISFAGAWMGYAFHEDGFTAGLAVAKKIMGATYQNPTSVRYGKDLKDWIPRLSLGSRLLRLVLTIAQFVIERVEDLIS